MVNKIKISISEDAIQLAKALYRQCVPNQKFSIVNVIKTSDPHTRESLTFPVMVSDTESLNIPYLYRYLYDETLPLLEDSGVTGLKIANTWFIKVAENDNDYKLTKDVNLTRFLISGGYLSKKLSVYVYPNTFRWYTSAGQYLLVIYNEKLTDFITAQNQKTVKSIKAPQLRNYWYEDGQLKFRMADGSVDQLDFSKAEVSRQLFESFWELWKSDGVGSYSPEQIKQTYNSLNKGNELGRGRVGEIVANIRSTILNPKRKIKGHIIWQYDFKKRVWFFKIS